MEHTHRQTDRGTSWAKQKVVWWVVVDEQTHNPLQTLTQGHLWGLKSYVRYDPGLDNNFIMHPTAFWSGCGYGMFECVCIKIKVEKEAGKGMFIATVYTLLYDQLMWMMWYCDGILSNCDGFWQDKSNCAMCQAQECGNMPSGHITVVKYKQRMIKKNHFYRSPDNSHHISTVENKSPSVLTMKWSWKHWKLLLLIHLVPERGLSASACLINFDK